MEAPFTADFFRRLQQLRIRTKKNYLGSRQGIHRSARKGHGLEFADYRPYSPGDDFRHIDWQLYAKTDKIYVREYREEQDLHVNVLLDTSSSMYFSEINEGGGEASKINLARNIAFTFGLVALSDGDSLTYSLLGRGSSPRFTGINNSSRAFVYLKKHLLENSSKDFDFQKAVTQAIARQSSPGRCYLISDFLFDFDIFKESIKLLKARNFDIGIIQVLAPSELDISLLEKNQDFQITDSENKEKVNFSLSPEVIKTYHSRIEGHLEEIENYAKKNAAEYICVKSSNDLQKFVFEDLLERKFLE